MVFLVFMIAGNRLFHKSQSSDLASITPTACLATNNTQSAGPTIEAAAGINAAAGYNGAL
jgi:hypothetical protein